jgi:hypothetical protein
MTAKVYWLDEPDIMVAEYAGDLTNDDIDQAMDVCLKTLDQQNCHFLVDTLQLKTLPKDIFKIGSLVKLINHPRRGWLIFVAQQNVMVKFAVQVLVRSNFKMMTDRDQAVAFLREAVRSAKSNSQVTSQ